MSFPTENAQRLKMQFHSTRKGDDETIESYVKRLKSIADSLAAIDSPISDSDMVLQLVAGLPSEYEPVKKIISKKRPLPTFEEACSMVDMQEGIFLQDHHEESSTFTTVEIVDTVVGAVGAVSSVVGAVSTLVVAVGALPTVAGAVGAVGASRMIVGCAVCAVGAMASWKVWQSQKKLRI